MFSEAYCTDTARSLLQEVLLQVPMRIIKANERQPVPRRQGWWRQRRQIIKDHQGARVVRGLASRQFRWRGSSCHVLSQGIWANGQLHLHKVQWRTASFPMYFHTHTFRTVVSLLSAPA